MYYGFCSVALIPCRAEPAERSEMVNQLLFGETYSVLDENEKWLKIETITDQYSGWIDRKLHRTISRSELDAFLETKKQVVSQPIFPIESDYGQIHLSFGAILPTNETNEFAIGSSLYRLTLPLSTPRLSLSEFSRNFLNAPYLWGGKSLFGIDCSGFSQVVFRCFGKQIPRDAYQQAEKGETIQLTDALSGDLAFFGEPDKKITHVGICLENGTIIHAAGKCRIDRLDNTGILNEETNNYTHQLRLIKRI